MTDTTKEDQLPTISRQEFFRVGNMLRGCDPIFAKLWQFGVPVWDATIDTAAVSCLKGSSKIRFHFNPHFWLKLSDYDRAFVIAHELVHVLSNHISRAVGWNQDVGNYALDVACNSTLECNFGMPKPSIDACTTESMAELTGMTDIPKDQSAEYYYNILMQHAPQVHYVGIDQHGNFQIDGESVKSIKELADKLKATEEEIKQAIEKHCNEQELAELKNKVAGTNKGGLYKRITYPPKPKRVWGDVIRKRLVRTMEKYKEEDQWLRRPRRISCWDNNGLYMPATMDTDIRVFDRLPVWLFQDTSGSCAHLAERFFAAARTIPKKQFIVKAHCFDTAVYETSLETGELYGFGGTSFACIEEYIQNYTREHNVPYPAAVFVVTDGAGDEVHPEHPDRWHWFLSDDTRTYIPAQSPTFMLDTFE